MTTISEARRQIQGAFKDYRDANFPGMETAWTNKRFETKGKKEFMRVSINHATGTRASLGTNHVRRAGTVFVQIFTQLDQDMRRSDTLAQSVLNLFRDWPSGPIRINEPALLEVGPDDAWFQVNVSATFQYDDFG